MTAGTGAGIENQSDGGLRELALFAGAGGGILGGRLLGWRTVCAVEYDPYARSVLLARQRDGHLERFPIWDDVRTFDGRLWRGSVDVISGGFPCQDISCAGSGAGLKGARSGLWGHMARIVCEVRPRHVLVENSPMLTSRGLGVVLGDLAAMGYDARWGVLGAHHVGAPHKRDRIWIVARDADRYSESVKPVNDEASGLPGVARSSLPDVDGSPVEPERGRALQDEQRHIAAKKGGRRIVAGAARGAYHSDRIEWWDRDPSVADADGKGLEGQRPDARSTQEPELGRNGALADADETQSQVGVEQPGQRFVASSRIRKEKNRSTVKPVVGRVAHGVADRVDRLRALGNGQVPAVVALAWDILSSPVPVDVATLDP